MCQKFFFPSCQFFRHSCVASDYNLIIACAKYEIFALPLNTAIHARAYDLYKKIKSIIYISV